MYKSLLIHNNNTPLINLVDDSIKFFPTVDKLNNSDIDSYISNEIIPSMTDKEFDVVYIKDTLSENYIDFYGLIVALHIRLSTQLSKLKNFIPIVILSDIDSYTINKISYLGKILFTKNIFIAPNNKSTLSKYSNPSLNLKALSEKEYYNNFLEKIEINPPKDYLSHHSITNEWAIHHWAQLLGANTHTLKHNENKISSMLYFKYLNKKHQLYEMTEIPDDIKNKEAKVLLIDDKCDDGWTDIMHKFILKFYTKVSLESLGTEYKDIRDITYITAQVKDKIINYDPDIILLDLRLIEELDSVIDIHNNQSNRQKINKISGIQLLRYIRDKKNHINQGIQIIIFSASTNSSILDSIYKQSVLGYIKKDSPNDKYLATKSSLSKLKQLISGEGGAIERKHLKNIWNTQEDILKLNNIKNAKLDFTENNYLVSIRNTIPQVFDILNSNVPKPFLYAMFTIFKCIEYINEMYFREERLDGRWRAIWKDSNNMDMIPGYSTEDRIIAIIKQMLRISNDQERILKSVHEIVCSRNFNIHGGEEKSNCRDNLIKSPTDGNIEEWFDVLYIILKYMDNAINE